MNRTIHVSPAEFLMRAFGRVIVAMWIAAHSLFDVRDWTVQASLPMWFTVGLSLGVFSLVLGLALFAIPPAEERR